MGHLHRGIRGVGAAGLLVALCGVVSALETSPSAALGAAVLSDAVSGDRPANDSAGEFTVPASVAAGVRVEPTPGAGAPPAVSGGRFDAATSVEVVGERGERHTVFRNSDGSKTLVTSLVPVNYQVDGRWERIDSRLVADATGFHNAANSWSVHFGSLASDGVRLTVGRDSTGFTLSDAADSLPTVGADGVSVQYSNVLPGVDIVYRVSGDSVEEFISLSGPDAVSSFRFKLLAGSGVFGDAASGFRVRKGGLSVRVSGLETTDRRGAFVDDEASSRLVPDSEGGGVLTVSVDSRWLRGLAADRFPVVIDPSFAPQAGTALEWLQYPGQATVPATSDSSHIRVGNPNITSNPTKKWRSVASFDLSSVVSRNVSKAELAITVTDGPSGNRAVHVYWANEVGWHNGVPSRSVPAPGEWPWGLASTEFATGTLSSIGTTETVDVTSLVKFWAESSIAGAPSSADRSFFFKGYEPDGVYTYKRATLSLSVTYNSPPTPALKISSAAAPNGNPADGSRWLSNPQYLLVDPATQLMGPEVTDEIAYRAEIATDSDFSQIVTTGDLSPWSDTSPPKYGTAIAGAVYLSPEQIRILEPGQTYFWRLAATDGSNWVRSTDGGATGPTALRSFTWDPDPAVAAGDTQGPLTVNLVSGRVGTSVSTPSFSTLGGPVGATLAYNSHDYGDYGLTSTVYRDSGTGAGVVDASDSVVMHGIDRAVSVDWGAGGPTSDVTDSFIAVWDGEITVPDLSGHSYSIGLECNTYGKLVIDGLVRVNRTLASGRTCRAAWTPSPGAVDWLTADGTEGGTETALAPGPHAIHVEVYDNSGPSEARLWARLDSQSVWEPVPSSWFTPAARQVLPLGWRLSIGPGSLSYSHATITNDMLVLIGPDGSRTAWAHTGTATTSGWRPEVGEDGSAALAPNGWIVVRAADGSNYLFDTSGNLVRVAGPSDSARRSTAIVVGYDSAGRPVSATDPVTGRLLDLQYQTAEGNANCPAAPLWLPATETMAPAGMLCAVRFKASATAAPELWTTVTFYTSSGNLARVINFPDLSASGNTNPDANQTTQFGWGAALNARSSPLNTVRTPLAYDAVRSGVRTDTADTWWAVTMSTFRTYWGYPSAITAPAPVAGAARPQSTYALVFDSSGTGATYTRATDVRISTAGLDQPPPNGYVARYASIDALGRVGTTYDIGGRSTALTWDNATNEVVESTQSSTQLRTKTIFDPLHGWPTAKWGPAPATDTCWAILDPNNTACADVPSTVTDYDQDWTNSGNGAVLHGLQAQWWTNTALAPSGNETAPSVRTLGVTGTATAGAVDVAWGTGGPAGLVNYSGSAVTDNFSANVSGDIVFPSTGTYTLKVEVAETDEQVGLWIDDTQIITAGGGGTRTGTYANTVAGSRHRIRISYVETTGSATLRLKWKLGTGTETLVPAANLYPAYGYPTRVTVNGTGTDAITRTVITNWATGATETEKTGNGTTSDLSTAYTYETGSPGWNRQLTRTLPAGNGWEYQYWPDGGTLPSTTCGVAAGTPQTSNLRRRVGPDPDDYAASGGTNGPGLRRVEEFVYDVYGHQRGSRVGYESAAGSKALDASVPWACITLDGMWRTTRTDYPAGGGYPARTVWADMAKNGNPLVAEACDDSVPGSPVAASDVCAGKGGVITTAVDLLGRTISTTDVWGKTVSTAYNQGGQITLSSGIFGDLKTTYTAGAQVDAVQFRATAGSGTYAVLADAAYSTSGTWAGMLDSVAYGNGTSLATLNGTSPVRRDTDGGIRELRFDGPGGVELARNTVTRDVLSGRVTAESYDGAGNTFGYAYDTSGRLTQAALPGGGTVGYWYGDGTTPSGCTTPGSYRSGRNSNRLCTTNGTSATATFGYDRADRLTGSTATGYTETISYDSRGNITAIGGEAYGYDGADRHLQTSNGTTTSTYIRDLTDQVVEYRLNGVAQNRYSGSVTLDATAANVVERTVGLPGGVTLTTRTSGDVWSYPNIAGSVTATANAAGTRIAGPLLYDPYGNPLTGYPDNQTGLLDNAWHGSADRQTQHQTGLNPAVDMGARQYLPRIGRFTETDPIEAGVDNDYGYPADPINQTDLTGECWPGMNAGQALGYEFRTGKKGKVTYWSDGSGRIGLSTMVYLVRAGIPYKVRTKQKCLNWRHVLRAAEKGSNTVGQWMWNNGSSIGNAAYDCAVGAEAGAVLGLALTAWSGYGVVGGGLVGSTAGCIAGVTAGALGDHNPVELPYAVAPRVVR